MPRSVREAREVAADGTSAGAAKQLSFGSVNPFEFAFAARIAPHGGAGFVPVFKEQRDGEQRLRYVVVGDAIGPAQTLAGIDEISALVGGPSGDVAAAGRGQLPEAKPKLAVLDADATAFHTQSLPATGDSVTGAPSVALDPHGNLIAAWDVKTPSGAAAEMAIGDRDRPVVAGLEPASLTVGSPTDLRALVSDFGGVQDVTWAFHDGTTDGSPRLRHRGYPDGHDPCDGLCRARDSGRGADTPSAPASPCLMCLGSAKGRRDLTPRTIRRRTTTPGPSN